MELFDAVKHKRVEYSRNSSALYIGAGHAFGVANWVKHGKNIEDSL